MIEQKCGSCGETYIVADSDIGEAHAQKEDGTECGGEPTGARKAKS